MAAKSRSRMLMFGLPAVLTAVGGVYLIGAMVAHFVGSDFEASAVAIAAGAVSLLLAMAVPLLLAGRIIQSIGPERVHASAVRATALALWNGVLIGGLFGAVPGVTADALRSGGDWIPGTAGTPLPTLAGWVADTISTAPEAESTPVPASDVDPSPTEDATAVDGEPLLSASDLFEQRADGVVVVKTRATIQDGNPLAELFDMMGATTREGHGSGFVVGPDLVVTNQHVIDQAEQVAIVTRDGRTLGPVKALHIDADHDLALLHVEDLNLPTVPLAPAEPVPSVGADTFAIGAPLGLSYSLTRGIVSAHRNVQGTEFLQMQTTVAPGSSGGPLFDDRGRVIAVNTATRYPGLNLAVQIRYVHDLLTAERSEQSYAGWTASLAVESLEVEGLDLRPTDREALANVMLQAGTVAIDCVDPLPTDAQIRIHTDFEMISSVDVTGNLGEAANQCVSSRLEFVAFALRMTATQLGVTAPVTVSAVVTDDARRLAVQVDLGTSPTTAPAPDASTSTEAPPEGSIP